MESIENPTRRTQRGRSRGADRLQTASRCSPPIEHIARAGEDHAESDHDQQRDEQRIASVDQEARKHSNDQRSYDQRRWVQNLKAVTDDLDDYDAQREQDNP